MNRNCLYYRDQWFNKETGREYKADILVDPSAKLYSLLTDLRRASLTNQERNAKRALVRIAWEGVIERIEILAAAETARAREPRIQFLKQRETQGDYMLDTEVSFKSQRLEFDITRPNLREYQKDALEMLTKMPKRSMVILGAEPNYVSMGSLSLAAERSKLSADEICPLCSLEKYKPKNVLVTSVDKRLLSMPKETYDKLQKLAAFHAMYSIRPKVAQIDSEKQTPAPKKYERMSALQKALLDAYLQPTK